MHMIEVKKTYTLFWYQYKVLAFKFPRLILSQDCKNNMITYTKKEYKYLKKINGEARLNL